MKRLNDKESGFTLIEVLVVILIVAILAAIAAPKYFQLVNSAHASEAKNAISRIEASASIYFSDHGEWPDDVETMEQEGLLEVAEATKRKWSFQLIGNPPTQITATSTAEMRGGEGKIVTYSVEEGKFSGYGFPTASN